MMTLTHEEKLLRAQEARRIMDEAIFKDVLSGMRVDALEALARAPADAPNTIIKLQSTIAVIDSFCDNFEAYILQGEDLAQEEPILP